MKKLWRWITRKERLEYSELEADYQALQARFDIMVQAVNAELSGGYKRLMNEARP